MENDPRIQSLMREVDDLKDKVRHLESRYEVAPRLPRTALMSDKFMSRSFAVFGHNFVASLIISIPFYILMFVIMMAVGFSF